MPAVESADGMVALAAAEIVLKYGSFAAVPAAATTAFQTTTVRSFNGS